MTLELGSRLFWVSKWMFPKNSGFSPQIIHFNSVFHYKPSILGENPYFWKYPNGESQKRFAKVRQTIGEAGTREALPWSGANGFPEEKVLTFQTEKTHPCGKRMVFFSMKKWWPTLKKMNFFKSKFSMKLKRDSTLPTWIKHDKLSSQLESQTLLSFLGVLLWVFGKDYDESELDNLWYCGCKLCWTSWDQQSTIPWIVWDDMCNNALHL